MAYREAMPELWDLMFTLPNLNPPIPTPFEKEGFVVCSGADPRLTQLAPGAANEAALKILKRFRTSYGKRYTAGCFLIRADVPFAQRSAGAIRAFRNVCALAATTMVHAASLESPGAAQWRVQWSDQFKFGYFVAGKNGWVQTLSGASMGMHDKIPLQQPDPQFSNPADWSMIADEPLLARLLTCWHRFHFGERDRKRMRRLFRSLEVAFHASLFPADGMTSINDIGARLALWISAFEVLFNPGSRHVDKRGVQRALAAAPFTARELVAKRYTVWEGKGRNRVKVRVTLPESVYDDLYGARNRFLHGSPVRPAMLHYRQDAACARLTTLAPALYSAALVSFLDDAKVAGGPSKGRKLTVSNVVKYGATRSGLTRVEKGFAAAAKPISFGRRPRSA
jgi:hypothetical protein